MRLKVILPAMLALAPLGAETLEVQCAQVAKTVAQWQADNQARVRNGLPPLPINLVLGATAQEAGRFSKAHWIFLDRADHGETNLPHLTADFNDLRDLYRVARALRGSVDGIYPDWSVNKFAKWNKDKLNLFGRMLAPGGVFYVEAEAMSGLSVDFREVPAEAKDAELVERFKLIQEFGECTVYPPGITHPQVGMLDKERTKVVWREAMDQVLKPAVAKILKRAFSRVEEVEMVASFLRGKGNGECEDGLVYFACSNDSKPKEELATLKEAEHEKETKEVKLETKEVSKD